MKSGQVNQHNDKTRVIESRQNCRGSCKILDELVIIGQMSDRCEFVRITIHGMKIQSLEYNGQFVVAVQYPLCKKITNSSNII